MSNKNTAPRVSSMGAAVYPAGQHPRDLRKQPQAVDQNLHMAYINWLMVQDEVTQEVAYADVARGFGMFQSYIAGIDPAHFALEAGNVPESTPMPAPAEENAPAETVAAKPVKAKAEKRGVVDTKS